jgi:hypothetical protein
MQPPPENRGRFNPMNVRQHIARPISLEHLEPQRARTLWQTQHKDPILEEGYQGIFERVEHLDDDSGKSTVK